MTEHDAGVEADDPGAPTRGLLERVLGLLPGSAVAIVDRDFRVIAALGEALTMRGFEPDAMVGKTVPELLPDEPVELLEPALGAAFAGESSHLEIRTADGSTWYQFEVRPVAENGKVVAAVGFATDITALKQAENQVAEERQFFEDVLDSIQHLVSVKDSERKVLHLNRFFEKYTGISRSDAIGNPIAGFFERELAERLHRDDTDVFERGETVRVERKLPAANGSVGTFLTERSPLRRADGSVYGIVTVGVDISDRLAAERDLAEARTLFETAFLNAPNGMALVALNGRFLRVNPAMSDLTGYPAEELTELKVADITHPDDMKEQVDLVNRALAGEFQSYSLEKRFATKSEETVWLVLAVSLVSDESGEPLYVIAQTTNISERKQVEVDLRSEVGRDPLTGLANRRQLESALDLLLDKCRREGTVASLLIMDFDDFKQVNDRHGHEAGDGILRFIAQELRGQIRATDLAGRIGGDEFVLLLDGVIAERAGQMATELMDHFDTVTYDPEGLNLACSASVGSAGIDAGTSGPQEALREADLAMYEAKRRRRSA